MCPPGYDLIVILPADSEFTGPKGFHFLDTDVAIAVVQYGDDWSLFASHELMEMLVDRRGDRTDSGPSLRRGQGRVDYLVEVCDPCQRSTYTIDGVLVSDFVTPGYYGDPPAMVDFIRSPDESVSPARCLTGDTLRGRRSRLGGRWQALAPVGPGSVPAVADSRAMTWGC